MNPGSSGVSGREATVTLAACVLLGLEVVPSLLSFFFVLMGFGLTPYSPLYGVIGSTIAGLLLGGVLGALLGVVLLRQGGVSVPSRGERGAGTGALAGIVVGLLGHFLLGVPIAGSIGVCVLVG